MGMAKKPSSLLLMILLIALVFMSRSTEARPLSIVPSQQRYAKIFGSLGIVCQCCDDGTSSGNNDCTSTWTEPCQKLQCLPWKMH